MEMPFRTSAVRCLREAMLVIVLIEQGNHVKLLQCRHCLGCLSQQTHVVIGSGRYVIPLLICINHRINGHVFDPAEFLLRDTEKKRVNIRSHESVKVQRVQGEIE